MAASTAPVKRERDESDNEEPSMKKQVIQGKSVLDTLLPITAITKTLSEEDFRIIVGTYERILYGINAYWEMEDSKRCLRLEPIFIVPAHTGLIRTVAVGGHFLASGSTDEIIRLYDVKKRKEYGSLGGHHQGDITDLQFHGKYMFSASDDKTICLWRTKDWEYLKTLKGHKGRINSLAIHPSGKIALSVSSDKTVVLWNLMTAHKASTTKLGRDEGQIVLWNSAGNQYAIMFDRKVCVYNVSDAQVATTIEQRSRLLCMRYYHSATNDKDYIITGSEDKKIRIWDASSGTCVAELSGHQWRIKTIDVIVSKPDAQEDQEIGVLISVSSDGVIKTWDIEGAIQAEDKDTIEPLGEYNIKARATCSTVHTGFAKKVAEKSAKQEKKNKEKTTED